MVLEKKVAIFYWEWGRTSAPRDGQKFPCFAFVVRMQENKFPCD